MPKAKAAEPSQPHNLEAERSVLGAIITNNKTWELVCQVLTEPDFYTAAHRHVWQALRELMERKVAVDIVTLRNELKRAGKGDLVDVGYVAGLADGVPQSVNIGYYAEIVREQAQLRRIIGTANHMLTVAYAGEMASLALIQESERQLLDMVAKTDGRMVAVSDTWRSILARLEHRTEHRGQLLGLSTGFTSIDQLTLGWQKGDLIVVSALTSIGKTAFALQSALAAASAGPVAIFSLEMRREQLETRILAQLAKVDAQRIRSGALGTRDMGSIGIAIEDLSRLKVHIDDRSGRSAIDVRHACRRLKAEQGLALIVVDYLQIMGPSIQVRDANENLIIQDNVNRLKDLADEVGAPVLALSQLSRAGLLKGSGAIDTAADTVINLQRKNHRAGGTTKCVLWKQRNGPTGTVNLTFDRDTQTFSDAGEETEPDPPPQDEPVTRPKRTRQVAGHRIPVDD